MRPEQLDTNNMGWADYAKKIIQNPTGSQATSLGNVVAHATPQNAPVRLTSQGGIQGVNPSLVAVLGPSETRTQQQSVSTPVIAHHTGQDGITLPNEPLLTFAQIALEFSQRQSDHSANPPVPASSVPLQRSVPHNGPGPTLEEITRRTDQYLQSPDASRMLHAVPLDRSKTVITELATAFIKFVEDLNLPVTNNAFDIRGDSQAHRALLHLAHLLGKEGTQHRSIVNRFIDATTGNVKGAGAAASGFELMTTNDQDTIGNYRAVLHDAMLVSDQTQNNSLTRLTESRRNQLNNNITAVKKFVQAFLHIRPLIATAEVGSTVGSWNRKPEAVLVLRAYLPIFSSSSRSSKSYAQIFISYLETGVATPPMNPRR